MLLRVWFQATLAYNSTPAPAGFQAASAPSTLFRPGAQRSSDGRAHEGLLVCVYISTNVFLNLLANWSMLAWFD